MHYFVDFRTLLTVFENTIMEPPPYYLIISHKILGFTKLKVTPTPVGIWQSEVLV